MISYSHNDLPGVWPVWRWALWPSSRPWPRGAWPGLRGWGHWASLATPGWGHYPGVCWPQLGTSWLSTWPLMAWPGLTPIAYPGLGSRSLTWTPTPSTATVIWPGWLSWPAQRSRGRSVRARASWPATPSQQTRPPSWWPAPCSAPPTSPSSPSSWSSSHSPWAASPLLSTLSAGTKLIYTLNTEEQMTNLSTS